MSKKKTVTAPLSYNPGKGRPQEYLAYLNWQEMQALQRLNGGNMERGPRGLPSFPPEDATDGSYNSGYGSGGGNWQGAPGGGDSYDSGGGSSYSDPAGEGGGSDYSGSSPGSYQSSRDTAASPESSSASQSPSQQQSSDTAAQNAAEVNNAREASLSSALMDDARKGGIASINVGPMQTPVTIGGGQIYGSLNKVSTGSYGLATPDVTQTSPDVAPASVSGLGSVPVPQMKPINDPTRFITANPNVLNNVNPVAISKLVRLQEEFGRPLTITSGFRDPETNKARGGVSKSQHIHGNAIDIALPGASAEETARLIDTASGVGFTGIGGYRPGKVHVDLGGTRVWGPSTGKESIPSLPSPMRDALRSHMAGTTPSININYAALESSPTFTAQPASSPVDSNAYGGSMFSGLTPDPIVNAAISGAAKLPSALSGFKIPSIAEASSMVKAMPDFAKVAAMKAMAPSMGDRLSGMFSAGIGAISDKISEYAPAGLAETKLAEVEDEYRNPYKDVYGPKYVPKDIQKEMSEIARKNEIATNIGKRVPGVGLVLRGADAIRNVLTGTTTAEADEMLKNQYLQSNPEQQAELERQYPNLTKFAMDAGLTSQLPESNYRSWAQRAGLIPPGAPIPGSGSAGIGGIPTQELGGKQSYETAYVSPGPSYPSYPSYTPTQQETGGRPYDYYLWDLGVGIPSPGDPDYNDYQEYLAGREPSART